MWLRLRGGGHASTSDPHLHRCGSEVVLMWLCLRWGEMRQLLGGKWVAGRGSGGRVGKDHTVLGLRVELEMCRGRAVFSVQRRVERRGYDNKP